MQEKEHLKISESFPMKFIIEMLKLSRAVFFQSHHSLIS